MENYIECTFTPKAGGAPFTVDNITSVTFNVSRTPGPAGRLGMKGHDIGLIHINRKKALFKEGSTEPDNKTLRLASATQKQAYFSGEVTIARPDDKSNKVQTMRWDEGHICNLASSVYNTEVIEDFDVCVTNLVVDDFEFKRIETA